MLVKVQKVGKSWFRVDTGDLVGREIPLGEYLDGLKLLYGNKLFLKNGKNIITLYHGYFDKHGNFNHFCKKSGAACIGCHEYIKNTFCPHIITNYKQSSGGFYAKITD